MRRQAGAVLALTAAASAAAPVTAQSGPIRPTYQLDRKNDVRGPLDVVRVAMSTRLDGSLRAELTMRRAWKDGDVGRGGSLCLKLYVRARPDADPPEYLVCASPTAAGDALTGRVMRNAVNGLPRTVGRVVLTRPTTRTIYLAFDPAAIRHPARLRFAGESIWRGPRCPKATGCSDLAPDAPGARDFRLRRGDKSG